jgi:hypothetical protein
MNMNISYINMCKLKNRMKKGIRGGEREGLVVMVCVVVHLVNHLNKKPFRPLYIFKRVLKNNFVLFI